MKIRLSAFISALLLVASSALSGDGYQHEANNAREVVTLAVKAKAGEVVKLRWPKVAFDETDNKNASGYYDYRATFFFANRGTNPANEFSIIVNEQQKRFLEVSQMVYLRRTKDGWEYLGTKVSRDAKGVTIYQY